MEITEDLKPNFVQSLIDHIGFIERDSSNFHVGYYPSYLNIARSLRILLCDKNRKKDISLALRVFPQLSLHQMENPITNEIIENIPDEYIPFTIGGIPDHLVVLKIFNEASIQIPLQDWLEQEIWISNRKIFNIKTIIKSVAEKDGGAHVDDECDDFLKAVKGWHHKGEDRRATGMHEPLIVGLGEYVARELKKQLLYLDIDLSKYDFNEIELTPTSLINEHVTPESIIDFQEKNKFEPIPQVIPDSEELIIISEWSGIGTQENPRRAKINDDYSLVSYSDRTGADSWPAGSPCPYFGIISQIKIDKNLIETLINDSRYFILGSIDDLGKIFPDKKRAELQAWLFFRGMSGIQAYLFCEQLRFMPNNLVIEKVIGLFRISQY